jgi:ubiquitin carboxyl-terminal hydrolase 35/38
VLLTVQILVRRFDTKLKVQTKLMHSGMYHNHTVTLPTVRSQADHATYSLYAVIIHTGTTLDSGHYYTLAKENDKWYSYNDEAVTDDPDNGQLSRLNRSSTPYILFYRRTDSEEGTVPAVEDIPTRLQESVMAHNKECVETLRMMLRTRP